MQERTAKTENFYKGWEELARFMPTLVYNFRTSNENLKISIPDFALSFIVMMIMLRLIDSE